MTTWLKISLLLCCFGYLKEIRPSEPFVTDFLTQPWRDITFEELNRYIFPIGTYSTAILLIGVLLITDFLRYKPVIIVIGISGIITYCLLLWTTSKFWTQIIQVSYATYMATEVAYFTYIYAKVDKEHYLKVTSHTRAALLCGRFTSGVLAQVLYNTKLMNIRELNFITLAAQVAATCWAFFLPSVQKSVYFHQVEESKASSISIDESMCVEKSKGKSKINYKEAFRLIFNQFNEAYSNRNVILWSVWYIVAMCGHYQVINYIQMLWGTIDNNPDNIWNGAVEAVTTILAASCALLASQMHTSFLKTKIKILWLLVILSGSQGVALFFTCNTTSRYISYTGYIVFYALYTFTLTISSAQIAKYLPEDSYGLIFGINTFLALVLQSTLTMVVANDVFKLNLNIYQQFDVYASGYCFLGLIYLVLIIVRSLRRSEKRSYAF